MNLALHGFLLQVIVSILNFKHGFRLCSAGEPGYLDFDNLPETNFSCQGKVIGGYYADVEAGCQMFHVCTIGQKDEIMDIKFLCLNGTVFDQETRVCERVDEVDCSKSERFYNLNLELYGNHAVTLSLHEEDDDDSTEHHDEHQQQQQLHITSARPSTTSTTTSTTLRPSQQSTTSATNVYQQHPTGYPQHYQPRPAFSSIQTSQSNTHYDDKNGGYHHQYIFHNDERSNDNQATSYQLFSNQGVSSTTPTSQVHQQVRYSSTMNPQVIHNEPSTVSPLQYHVQSTSSTIQTLLNSNSNNPALINPIFHNHGIASTTEQFNVHNNNPREINDYQDDSEDERDEQPERRPLEPVQSTNKGKVSKLTISPVPRQQSRSSVTQTKSSQSTQQQRISINFLPTPNPVQTTISAFYPTQRSTQQTQKSQNNPQVTQHIHVPPPPSIPQLKPQQITINLPPPDIQRIVQNPSPLLPSQSRVIVTAKASVSDESGRPLNASQLITLPLSTIPSNYDDYKEGDESFDPFYRDVPKIRHNQRIIISRKVEANERSRRKKRSTVKDNSPTEEVIYNAEIKDIKDLKANLPIIKAILFGLPIPENKESSSDIETTNNKTTIKMITDNLYNNNESRKSIPVQNEEKYIDVEVPEVIAIEENKKNSKSVKSRINNIHQELEFQRPSNTLQRQIDFNPIIVNQGKDDTELKNSIKLLLGEAKNGNSSPRNKYSAINVEVLNSSNEKKDNNDTFVEKELLQTRSSSHANKSNRRRYQNSESLESDEYTVRRSERINRPKSSKYYDEYDTSESVESNTKQRSNRLRQRPKNRRIINYRDDYIDEDIEDEEYDEENIRRTHKNRRGPQSRRTSFRNRNNHFDYEEDEEVDEKPRVRAKSSNVSNRSRIKSETDTFVEDKRHKSDTERRKNQRKRPTVFEDDTPSEENTEILNGQNFEESDSKLSKEIDPRVIVQENKKHSRYSLKSEQDKQHHLSTKKRYNSLERDEESGEELNDQIREDYLDPEELYSDEYDESVEEDVPDDYVDYEDSRDQISSAEIEHQKNRNKFDDDLELIPQSKSHRRNKGRKFVEETKINLEDAEKKLEYEDIDTTTLSENQESKTINISVESTTSEQITTLKDEDYNSEKITSVIDDFENTESPEYIKSTIEDITTEGVFKFTGELPQIEKKDNEQENSKQKDKEVIDVEDYVDDNYEPLSYIDPQIKEPVFSLMNNAENDKHVLTINDQPKEIQKISNTSINISEFEMKNNKENDETYDDKLEKTTIFSSSEDYDNTEITETDIIHKTSSPIPSSTAASPLSILSLMNSTTSTSTSTSTILTTSMPTITTTSTTTTSTTTTSTTTTPTTTTSTTTTTVKPISTKSTPTTLSTKATPKFFKPTRKNYVYIPPSTTPNAVVIRRGQPLAGPKPTKPPPSYNELAPKPVIRRLPLLSRTTTTTSEATILEENIAAELSKHLAQDSRKNVKKNETSIPEVQNITTSPEITKVSTVSSVTKSQSTEITTEDFELTTLSINQTSVPETSTALPVVQNQSAESKEQNFDNEVSKQSSVSNNSNNLPQQSDDSIAETSKPQGESITFDQEDLTNLEITTLNMDSDSKIVDSRTTTPRNVKPSERRKLELTSVKTQIQKSKWGPKQSAGFNCLEKEMYRFYGDSRDCRLFHYCSPGFTARQVLDFRFVCEEGTIFDEESQSCRHDVPNPKCLKRTL